MRACAQLNSLIVWALSHIKHTPTLYISGYLNMRFIDLDLRSVVYIIFARGYVSDQDVVIHLTRSRTSHGMAWACLQTVTLLIRLWVCFFESQCFLHLSFWWRVPSILQRSLSWFLTTELISESQYDNTISVTTTASTTSTMTTNIVKLQTVVRNKLEEEVLSSAPTSLQENGAVTQKPTTLQV